MKKFNMKKAETECKICGLLAFCYNILAVMAMDKFCPWQMELCWKYLAMCSICASGCLARCFWLARHPKQKKTR